MVGLTLALAGVALVGFTGDSRWWLVAIAGAFIVVPLLPIGVIVLLRRSRLVDEEAAGRLGYLHGLGLLMLPVVAIIWFGPDSPAKLFVIPAVILGMFGIDVLIAIAFRFGLTKRRSFAARWRGERRADRPSVLRDPARFAVSTTVDAHMRLLRASERERYSPKQAVGRLCLILAFPVFLVGVIGVVMAIGSYDGTPLIIIGVIGTALCLAVGLELGMSDDSS